MLKRLGALTLAVGLCLPYGCDVRPITGVWQNVPTIVLLGVPVLATLIYVLHTLVPTLAAFHERHSRTLHAVFRVVYYALLGGFLALAVTKRDGWPGPIEVAAALVVTGVLAVWPQHRGTSAARLPLLLLTVVGVPEVAYLVGFLREGGVQLGGWVFTAGWVLAVLAEVQVLAASPPNPHGG
ncbi:MAG TPA: hypothetical protein VLB49_03730 [Gemmatimonadales bacterium]|nr:hypothetical protein [Gemmatimonadales bacterium]